MAAVWGTEIAQSAPPPHTGSAGGELLSSRCPLGADGFTPAANGCRHGLPHGPRPVSH